MTHWVREERDARGIKTTPSEGSEELIGLVERIKTEAKDAVDFVGSIVRSPQALAIILAMGTFLAGGELYSHAQAESLPNKGASISSSVDSPIPIINATPTIESGGVLTDEQALAMRTTRIQAAASRLAINPDAWKDVPQSCRMSMAKISLYNEGSTDSNSGSSIVISGDRVVDQNGAVAWIYRIVTADHVVRGVDGKVLDGTVVLYPGSHTDQDAMFQFLDYTRFVDENGIPQDSGVVTVFRTGANANIVDPKFAPLGIEKVKTLESIIMTDSFYSLDYPGVTGLPQYTTSDILGNARYPNNNLQKIMEPVGDSSTVARGSSGGAVCDENGNLIGTVSGYEGNWPANYYMENNPTTIQQQIEIAANKSILKLSELGFKISKP